MDGTAAINHNLEALKRIVASLVAMAGLARAAPFTSPLWGGRREASGGGRDAGDSAAEPSDDSRPPRMAEVQPGLALPRHLHRAILRLLRPAESAARRLIIAAARGLVVTLPPPRKSKPGHASLEPQLRRFGIAIVVSPAATAGAARHLARSRATQTAASRANPHPGVSSSGAPGRTALSLFDPPRRFSANGFRRYVPAHAAPRILLPGIAEPHRLPPPPSRDDPVDATRLSWRLAALAAALDDLPGQARRFARRQAREMAREARGAGPSARTRRISPLRAGRPPAGRLSRFDPTARRSANIRDVDEVLAHAHALAHYALRYPDTS